MRRFVSASFLIGFLGATVALALAAIIHGAAGSIYEAPVYKVFIPIGLTGAAAAWYAMFRVGSEERKLFAGTCVGTLAGILISFRFLLGEQYEGLGVLKLGLTLVLCSGLASAAGLTVPVREPLPTMGQATKRKVRVGAAAVIAALVIGWYVPPTPWRMYWNTDIQVAALRHLDFENYYYEFDFTFNEHPISPAVINQVDLAGVGEPIKDRSRPQEEGGRLTCRLSNLRWVDAVTVHMDVDTYISPMAAGGSRLVLQLTPSGWVVVDDITEWIA
jgi:hypothetical protein